MVTPLEFVDGETPLIVSLHGYGGNSADHTTYVPLHERVNTDGFTIGERFVGGYSLTVDLGRLSSSTGATAIG